jgi:hypothetical protein
MIWTFFISPEEIRKYSDPYFVHMNRNFADGEFPAACQGLKLVIFSAPSWNSVLAGD